VRVLRMRLGVLSVRVRLRAWLFGSDCVGCVGFVGRGVLVFRLVLFVCGFFVVVGLSFFWFP